jgi:hypothetical protein
VIYVIAEYSPVLALWLVSVACVQIPPLWRARGLACLRIVPCEPFPQEDPSGTAGGRAAARLHRQPIPRALTTPPAGTRKRSIAVQEPRHCGCADGSVVTGARLDVPDLAQFPGGRLGAGLPKVLSTVVLRRVRGHAPGASIKQRPAHPAARRTRPARRGAGHQDKPAHKSTPQRPPASSSATL